MFGIRDEEGDAATSTDTVGRWDWAAEGRVHGSGDASGRLVHGRYRLIAKLGAGGMGVTYRAWDTQARVPVVVKMPKREVRHDWEVMTRFAREIEAMRAAPHPSIVPITDSGDDSGCPFVVMRFLPGGSLADYRRRDAAGNPLRNPPGMLHFWLRGVAAALDHIHSRGMLHRDVKPGNIFLDGFLKPYLGDFGIAKVVDESGGMAKEQTLTATTMAVGTPEYMAPELFAPKVQLDGRVDQYALAAAVYEMLCGEKPFSGSTAHIIVEHSSRPVPPLEERCPGLPRSVCAAVHKALSKTPEERFPTCGEFAAAALLDLPPLAPEADTVRLLCPNCKNILKLPNRAAGKSGSCPRCHTALDVAADLGSLWLESEERGEGMGAGADGAADAEAFADKSAVTADHPCVWRPPYVELPSQGRFRQRFISNLRAVVLALLIGNSAALLWWVLIPPYFSPRNHAYQLVVFWSIWAAAFVARRTAKQIIDYRFMWVGLALLFTGFAVVPALMLVFGETPWLKQAFVLICFNGLAFLLLGLPPFTRWTFATKGSPASNAVVELFSLARNEDASTIALLPDSDALHVTLSGHASGKGPLRLRLKKELAAGMTQRIKTLIDARHGSVLAREDGCVYAGRYTEVTDRGPSWVVQLFDPSAGGLSRRALVGSGPAAPPPRRLEGETQVDVPEVGADGASARARLSPELQARFAEFLANDDPAAHEVDSQPPLTAADATVEPDGMRLESEEHGEGVGAGDGARQPVPPPQEESVESMRALGPWRWPVRPSWIAVLSACSALALGYVMCVLHAQARAKTDFAYPVFLADETNSITSLSVEDARRYVKKANADRYPRLSFDAVTTLSAEVARELAKAGGSLSLDGLQTLTPEVAKELGAFKGWKLTLNGLKTLPPECVPLLRPTKHESCNSFEFNGLTSLSPELASALGTIYGLSLNGLKSLSPELAAVLGTIRHLSLDGLTTIDQKTAEMLTAVDQKTAEASSYSDRSLSLGGLTALSADTAQTLVKRHSPGGLELTLGVGGDLTVEVAVALAESVPQGNEPLFNSPYIILKNVGTLSAAAAAALPKNIPLSLHGAQLDADAATALTKDRERGATINLLDPVDLTPAVARLLPISWYGLYMLRAKTISSDVAEALVDSRNERSQLLLELADLEPNTARILAKSSRPIRLSLKRVPVELAAALTDHQSPVAVFPEEFHDKYPLRCSPAALEILKSCGGIRLPLCSFSPLSFVLTWCATGVSRSTIYFLWGAFFVGLMGLLVCGARLRSLGRQTVSGFSAATARSISTIARMAWCATVMTAASLVLIEFIVPRYVLPWIFYWANDMGTEMPGYLLGKCVIFLMLPVTGLCLLLSAVCGRQSRWAWPQAQVFSMVGEPKWRFLWWGGVVALFVMLFAVEARHFGFDFHHDQLLDRHRYELFGFSRRDDGVNRMVQGILLCLLATATYSLLRPGSRWVLAIANVLMAAMIVCAAWIVPDIMHHRYDLPMPGGFGLLTVAWAIPLVAGWLLSRAAWFMVTLFASPHGGLPHHVCSSEGVAVDSAWVVPWSAFSAYEWDDDRLVLHRAGRFVLSTILSGTVPAEQRVAADALLASRLPKAGGRGG